MNRRTFIQSFFTGSLTFFALKNMASIHHISNETARMPVLFLAHGSPTNAIENNPFTQTLKQLGKELPRPKAILCISAHWLTKGTQILHVKQPQIIYDFYGFPKTLYEVKYPAPGTLQWPEKTQKLIHKTNAQLTGEWGLDHGCWTLLVHMYPQADIPVYEMSIDYHKPFDYHVQLAEELKKLRNQGVLIIGSGNITHNLKKAKFPDINAAKDDWALAFDEKIKNAILNNDRKTLIHPHKLGGIYTLAVPEPSHYLPLLYTIGLAYENEEITFPYEAIEYGNLSMRCVKIG